MIQLATSSCLPFFQKASSYSLLPPTTPHFLFASNSVFILYFLFLFSYTFLTHPLLLIITARFQSIVFIKQLLSLARDFSSLSRCVIHCRSEVERYCTSFLPFIDDFNYFFPTSLVFLPVSRMSFLSLPSPPSSSLLPLSIPSLPPFLLPQINFRTVMESLRLAFLQLISGSSFFTFLPHLRSWEGPDWELMFFIITSFSFLVYLPISLFFLPSLSLFAFLPCISVVYFIITRCSTSFFLSLSPHTQSALPLSPQLVTLTVTHSLTSFLETVAGITLFSPFIHAMLRGLVCQLNRLRVVSFLCHL